MRTLDFTVNGQKIMGDPGCDFSGIAKGSRGYLFARFRFDGEWRGCRVVAVFSSRGVDYPTPIQNCMCRIPDEALTGSTVGVKVIGQKGDMRITTNRATFTQS